MKGMREASEGLASEPDASSVSAHRAGSLPGILVATTRSFRRYLVA